MSSILYPVGNTTDSCRQQILCSLSAAEVDPNKSLTCKEDPSQQPHHEPETNRGRRTAAPFVDLLHRRYCREQPANNDIVSRATRMLNLQGGARKPNATCCEYRRNQWDPSHAWVFVSTVVSRMGQARAHVQIRVSTATKAQPEEEGNLLTERL